MCRTSGVGRDVARRSIRLVSHTATIAAMGLLMPMAARPAGSSKSIARGASAATTFLATLMAVVRMLF
jgi:hypothetical protein